MKKKILVFTCLVILIIGTAIALVIHSKDVYNSYKEKEDNPQKIEETDGNEKIKEIKGYEKIEKENIGKEKTTGLNGQKINAAYVYSQNLSFNTINKIFDEYSIYDIYEDDDNEYIYLDNTDICCGVRRKNFTTNPEVTIEEKEASAIAEKFFMEVNGKDNGYTYTSCEYIEWGNYYEYIWTKYISDLKTDDMVNIWVDGSGEIISYSALKMNRYDEVDISKSNANEVQKADLKEVVNSDNYKVTDQYVTYDENGKLVLANVVEVYINVGEFSEAEIQTINVAIQ